MASVRIKHEEMVAVVTLDHLPPLGYARIEAQLRAPAIEPTRAALDGRDPLARPWLTDETTSAASAALRRP